jgi:hypothetical protein
MSDGNEVVVGLAGFIVKRPQAKKLGRVILAPLVARDEMTAFEGILRV